VAGVRIRFWWIVVFLFVLVVIVGFPGLRWVPIADAIQNQSKKLKEAHLSADSPKEAQRPLTPSANGEEPNTSKNQQPSSSIVQPTVLTQPNQPSNKAELQKVLRLHHEYVKKQQAANRLPRIAHFSAAEKQRKAFVGVMEKEMGRIQAKDRTIIDKYVSSFEYRNECSTINGRLTQERIFALSLQLGHCKNFILNATAAHVERAMYVAFLEIDPLRTFKSILPNYDMKIRYPIQHAAHYWFVRSEAGTIESYVTDLDTLEDPGVFFSSYLPRAYADTIISALADSERKFMKEVASRIKEHAKLHGEIRNIAAQIQSIAGLSPVELK
jgi:hypothetical protein